MSRLIEKLDDEEKLLPSDDGYCVYWAEGGYMTAEHLREIADELDRRNKTWHEQVMHDVGIPMPDTVCTDFQPDWTMPLSEYKRIQEQSMPKIKPLVWVQTGRDWRAATPIGTYEVWEVMGNNRWRWMQQGFPGGYCDSEALAKAACQQEYERRVRECLE